MAEGNLRDPESVPNNPGARDGVNTVFKDGSEKPEIFDANELLLCTHTCRSAEHTSSGILPFQAYRSEEGGADRVIIPREVRKAEAVGRSSETS